MSQKNDDSRLSKAERTAQAREQARVIREAQAKKEKRNSWLIRGGVLVAAVAVVVIVALFIVQAQKTAEPIANSGSVPANANAYGGVTLAANNAVVPPTTTATTVDKATLPAAPATAPAAATDLEGLGIANSGDGKPVQIVAYIDFLCPHCKNFEDTFSGQLKQWQDAGKATVEYRPTGLLDVYTTTNYSSRAAAAAACVVNTAPDKYKTFMDALFAQQPAENGPGLSNDQLKKIASDAGVDVGNCVDSKTYRPYAAFTTASATSHGINGTPTVFVDGQQWSTGDFGTFATAIVDAKK
ncbi:DsbA family protein [Arthrobacter sp. 35W]|uniref:DsbA family protein n=1 Tax=Arthrobacter sp. 35W TaxID=1132441 RepID=UPI00041F73B7|nr:thioredoxin domain-containing protein [Arthrobacter sp. 35W]